MRWILTVLLFAAVTYTLAEPEPKKYKPETKTDKQTNASLTEDEKQFLREVEAKFGVKSDAPIEIKTEDDDKITLPTLSPQQIPAVIAIEIVNDTDSKTKDKRTVDANLGYGYKTNGGYQYRYFGKPTQDKGKFMIYPYSQEDIPAPNYHSSLGNGGYSQNAQSADVEIHASQAFELKEVGEDNSYHYDKPAVEFKSNTPTTFYTTYNAGKFSGLSTQFPKVMQNYYVDPSQLLQNPQYQTAGLTQEHYRPHGSQLEQRVIPVLVLRIPSSYLRNPTAELYPNLPQNYPLSQHLNSVNLQELVNQYFSKMGYSSAPQVMSYLSQMANQKDTASGSFAAQQVPQTYSAPYIKPSYTQADYSGVQYSAVQPVMAKYPPINQAYYSSQSARQPNYYQYQVQHTQPSPQAAQSYYTQPRYQYQTQQSEQLTQPETDSNNGEYAALQYNEESSTSNYGSHNAQVDSTSTPVPQYDISEGSAQYASNEPQHQTSAPALEYNTPLTEYGSNQAHAQAQIQTPRFQYKYEYQYPKQELSSQQYYTPQVSQPAAQELFNAYNSQNSQSADNSYESLAQENPGAAQYEYQKEVTEDTSEDSLPLSENFPSKDHTQATVYPNQSAKSHNAAAVQSVSYVTPVPYTKGYQSKYRMMVPQTIFKHTPEKVHYVNSQSLPESAVQIRYHGQNNPEEEYTVSPTYIPPVSRQKPPSYPRNYHSHPKRNTRPVHKDTVVLLKKSIEKREEKKP